MTPNHRPCWIAVLTVALIAVAATTQAFIVDWMPIFGVVNGVDVARLNVALADTRSGPCRVSLAFVNGDGNMVGDPNEFTLVGSKACSSISSAIRMPGLAVECDYERESRSPTHRSFPAVPSAPGSASRCSTV
jgi:hypothetical protein